MWPPVAQQYVAAATRQTPTYGRRRGDNPVLFFGTWSLFYTPGTKANAIENQGEARNIRNQGFYQSTVQAMEARKGAKSPTENGALAPAPGQQDLKSADKDVAVPVPPKKESGGSSEKDEEMEEIPIAGRVTMKVPKPKNEQKQEQDQKQEEKQGGDDHKAAMDELNSILKRAPGMSLLPPPTV